MDKDNFIISDTSKFSNYNFPLEDTFKTWNANPLSIKNSKKLKPFKKLLTEHYLSYYQTICVKNNTKTQQQTRILFSTVQSKQLYVF